MRNGVTDSRAQVVAGIERELLDAVRRPGTRREAGAAGAAWRRVLQRGSRRPGRVAAGRRAGTARRERPQRRDDCPSSPTTQSSRYPRRSPPDGIGAVPVEPLGPREAGLVAHVSAYEELALDAALRGGRDRVVSTLLAHPLIGQYDRGRRRWPTRCSRRTPTSSTGHDPHRRRRRARGSRPPRPRPSRSRSTAATARPTRSSCAAPARSSRACARRRLPPADRRGRRRDGAARDRGRVAALRVGRAGASSCPPTSPARTCPEEEDELRARLVTAGLGRPSRGRQRHDGVAAQRRAGALGRRRRVRRRASTRSAAAPDGTVARFPALGAITGDWGGGEGLARSALWSAVRGEDGRGPTTALAKAIARLADRPSAFDVGLSLHLGTLSWPQLRGITPLLFDVAASGDPVATAIVERLAAEIAGLAAVLVDGSGCATPRFRSSSAVACSRRATRSSRRSLDAEIAARGLRVTRRVPHCRRSSARRCSPSTSWAPNRPPSGSCCRG